MECLRSSVVLLHFKLADLLLRDYVTNDDCPAPFDLVEDLRRRGVRELFVGHLRYALAFLQRLMQYGLHTYSLLLRIDVLCELRKPVDQSDPTPTKSILVRHIANDGPDGP